MPDGARAVLEREAARLGFERVRVAPAGPAPNPARFLEFLEEGRHADMAWLAETRALRLDPRTLLPDARSVVVLSMRYGGRAPPDPGGLTGRVASYAWGRDYHNLVGLRVRHLRKALAAALPGVRTWGGVDSGPVWERAWAEASGLGFSGKNGMIFVPGDTARMFVAVLLLDVPLAPDAPLPGDHCGRCRRCIDACPTAALLDGGGADAGRCISYLTIEHRGPIPPSLRAGMGRWVFGCDDCIDPCPHERALPEATEPDFSPRHAWLSLPALLLADDRALRDTFEGTPLRRAGPARLRRNAAVALGNLGDPRARVSLERARPDADALLREHVDWALDVLR